MYPRVSTIWAFLTLILPFVTAHWNKRHQLAHRARGDVNIHKRQSFSNARLTFYDVGLGACGQTSVASDWIVALNIEQYGSGYPGPYCFQTITISYDGKTAQAVIMDECPGCPYGGLDLSRGLFDYFASESVGVLYATWWFDGNDGGGQTTTSTTTTTPQYTPPSSTTTSTTEYTPPPTTYPPTSTSTSTPTPTPTTTSTPTPTPTPTSSVTSGSSSQPLSSGSAVPSGGTSSPGIGDPQNIAVINRIMVALGIGLSVETKSE